MPARQLVLLQSRSALHCYRLGSHGLERKFVSCVKRGLDRFGVKISLQFWEVSTFCKMKMSGYVVLRVETPYLEIEDWSGFLSVVFMCWVIRQKGLLPFTYITSFEPACTVSTSDFLPVLKVKTAHLIRKISAQFSPPTGVKFLA